MFFERTHYEVAAQVIQNEINTTPQIGLILGSGLGSLADLIENPTIIPYSEIPNWPQTKVVGHHGRLVIGQLEGKDVLAMQGRAHFYEGHSMQSVGFPVRVMQMLGIKTLIVTNAAGGLNTTFKTGDLMLINDHINLLGMMGFNPLIGPNDDSMGVRFPDFGKAYDPELRHLALSVAEKQGLNLRQGVYICLSGPTYETPADIRMLRMWGADAVGMSTVPEVVVARHGGIRVMGISTITNVAIDSIEAEAEVSHEEVLEVGKMVVPNLIGLLRGVLQEMA